MQAFNVSPEILLDVLAGNFTLVGDEVGHIKESFVLGACIMEFDNGSWDNVDAALFCQGEIFV